MRGVIIGIANGVADLVARITSARTTALDNLDAAVTTRAPASTALSTAVWTPTKAGYLDAALSTVAGAVNSIQTGWFHAGGSPATGTGEDLSYFDITLGTAVTVAKAKPTLQATDSSNPLTCRLTSTNNLRVSSASGTTPNNFRWYVEDFK